MANILGLSFFFHDSAAALVQNGQLQAAAAEERFVRRKHTSEFPSNAISFCLDMSGCANINQIDAIVYYEKPVVKLFRATQSAVRTWPKGLPTFVRSFPAFLTNKVDIRSVIKEKLPGYRGDVLFSEHHLSHAASAYFPSPFESAAILTLDGVGEFDTTTIGKGENQEITLLESIRFPHSVGLFYSALTAYLGFEVNEGEWKVMGLAPYGEDTFFDQLADCCDLHQDGGYSLNMDYFDHDHSAIGAGFNRAKWAEQLGIPPRLPDDALGQDHKNLARSGQRLLEEMVMGLGRKAKQVTGENNLVLAGGVALNGVANWKLAQSGLFDDIWVQPAAGDDGGAVGAALAVANMIFHDTPTAELAHGFWGPSFTDHDYSTALADLHLQGAVYSTEEMIEVIAAALAQNKVVGWFQGRMEFGPRALGARSILANPCDPNMKEVINSKVKYRESFRPFAPVVTAEDLPVYFDVPVGMELPFMVQVVDVREEYRTTLPAITHEDGTARVQSITKQSNHLLHTLLTEFRKHSGVPVLLNTSFNVRGEPIACTPSDAIHTFFNSDIDILVLGNHIATRDGITQEPDGSSDEYNDNNTGSLSEPDIKTKVLDFYQQLPFNVFSNAVDYAARLQNNPIKQYPKLHKLLRKQRSAVKASILDVGCGAGWFVNASAFHYGLGAVGIDLNPLVLKQASAVSRALGTNDKTVFISSDVFNYEPERQFDLVNTVGVLHHTGNCTDAMIRCLDWVKPGGHFHIGLYNQAMREPLIEHFQHLKGMGASETTLYEEFSRMVPEMTDPTHRKSWFRDQVLHPHETTHSYREISELIRKAGFDLLASSINNYRRLLPIEEMEALEWKTAKKNRALIDKKTYVPGFFTILAMRKK